jgi:hypothetical protein
VCKQAGKPSGRGFSLTLITGVSANLRQSSPTPVSSGLRWPTSITGPEQFSSWSAGVRDSTTRSVMCTARSWTSCLGFRLPRLGSGRWRLFLACLAHPILLSGLLGLSGPSAAWVRRLAPAETQASCMWVDPHGRYTGIKPGEPRPGAGKPGLWMALMASTNDSPVSMQRQPQMDAYKDGFRGPEAGGAATSSSSLIGEARIRTLLPRARTARATVGNRTFPA